MVLVNIFILIIQDTKVNLKTIKNAVKELCIILITVNTLDNLKMTKRKEMVN